MALRAWFRSAAWGLLLAGLPAGCRNDPGLPPRPAEEPFALRQGRLLYHDWCAGCHGAAGKGDGLGWASDLPGKPADLSGLSGLRDQAWLEAFLREGRPERLCPGWGHQFTPSELADLSRFLLSGLPPEPP